VVGFEPAAALTAPLTGPIIASKYGLAPEPIINPGHIAAPLNITGTTPLVSFAVDVVIEFFAMGKPVFGLSAATLFTLFMAERIPLAFHRRSNFGFVLLGKRNACARNIQGAKSHAGLGGDLCPSFGAHPVRNVLRSLLATF